MEEKNHTKDTRLDRNQLIILLLLIITTVGMDRVKMVFVLLLKSVHLLKPRGMATLHRQIIALVPMCTLQSGTR